MKKKEKKTHRLIFVEVTVTSPLRTQRKRKLPVLFGINYKLKAKVIRVVTGAITERKWERKAPKAPKT